MSKTVGTVLKIAGAAMMVYATGGGSLALFGAQFGATAIAVAGAVATAAGTLMAPMSGAAMQDQGSVLRMQTDATAPRRILYGQAATGGTLIFRETVGAENTDLHMVLALAGHRIDGLTGLKFGDKTISFTGTSTLSLSGQYASHLSVSIYSGDDNQLAAAPLVAASSKWTDSHRLCGIAYAHVKAVWDPDIFPQGMEGFLFTLKGRKLYDPRKDSSIGGFGVHRVYDEGTWEWSDNPVLCMADYLLGIRVGGKLVAGVGVDPTRIDWPNVMAEALICDDDVALKSGGVEKRYTANGWIDPTRSHRENLAALGSACGGTMVFQGGKWRAYVASPRPAIKSRSSDDVVGPISLLAKKSSARKINCVRGVYADPQADYQLKDFPPVQVQAYVDADGGQELWTDLNLPMTKSSSMAQRLSKIALGRARMEKSLSCEFSLVALQDQAMDAINFSHARFNLDQQRMLITDWQLTTRRTKDGSDALAIQCGLLEDDDLIYDWSNAVDEVDVSPPGTVLSTNRRYVPLEDLPGKVTWQTQVWGVGKPANFADVTLDNAAEIVTRQATPPAHKDGRIWVDITNEDVNRSDGGLWHPIGSRDALRLTNGPQEAGANVTETRTSADTGAVNGKAASEVKNAAINTEKLLANDASVVVHKTSIPADLSGIGTFIIDGLQVTGSVTYINTTELQIGDNIMLLNADEIGAPSQNAGIEIERGTSANVSFIWDEAFDRWSFDQPVYMGGVLSVQNIQYWLNGAGSATAWIDGSTGGAWLSGPLHMNSSYIEWASFYHFLSGTQIKNHDTGTIALRSNHVWVAAIRLENVSGTLYGQLYGDANGVGVVASSGAWAVRGYNSGASLYSNGVEKLSTISAGVSMAGMVYFAPTIGATAKAWIDGATAGDMWLAGTGTATDWTATSDRRLKKAIRPLLDSLARIMAMRPVSHEWRAEKGPEGRYYALIAQELQLIEPSLVIEGEDGFLSINYAKITPLLIGAIQDLQAQHDSLLNRVAKLEGAA